MTLFSIKYFADSTLLLWIVYDINTTRDLFNEDLKKISKCTYTWKMQFNTDVKNQAQEVILPKKAFKPTHLVTNFNDLQVTYANIHIYL